MIISMIISMIFKHLIPWSSIKISNTVTSDTKSPYTFISSYSWMPEKQCCLPVQRQTYGAGQMVEVGFTLERGLMDLINSFSRKVKICFQTTTEIAVMDKWVDIR